MLFHHVGMFASDFEASHAFYAAALRPLGVAAHQTQDGSEFWLEESDTPSLALDQADAEPTRGVHIAFDAADRDAVDAFFQAAVAAGGEMRHEPRYWPEYRAYCAFVSDPDGNNIEAVHKEIHNPPESA